MWGLLMVAALAAPNANANGGEAAPVYAIRRDLPPDSTVAVPLDAVRLALADAKSFEKTAAHEICFLRYVWVQDWIEPASGFGQVSLVSNSTLSRTANIIQPALITDEKLPGVLVRINLLAFVAHAHQADELAALYEKLAPFDSYFNVRLKIVGNVAVEVIEPQLKAGDSVEIKLQNGDWWPAKFSAWNGGKATINLGGKLFDMQPSAVRFKGQALTLPAGTAPPSTPQPHFQFAPAAYLGADGVELFRLLKTNVPIMRLDEWVAFTFSTVNGGLYYDLVGIKKTLQETIRDFAGNDAAEKVARFSASLRAAEAEHRRTGESILKIATRIDPELAKTKAYITSSGVTGRQRLVVFFFGAATSPAQGPQLVAVTFDIGEDNLDPEADPLRNPTVYQRYDGGEAIFPQANGMLVYYVFNAKDETIASVPDSVTHDFAAREVRSNASTARVFAGLSCAHCHDRTAGNWGWQPVVNDYYDTLRGLGQVLNDRGQKDQLRALQLIGAQYGANNTDLKQVLDSARLPYQFRAHLATNHKTTRETVFGLADSYWGYWYDRVTPEVAARDMGHVMSADKAQLFLLNAIDPEPSKTIDDLLIEDAVLLRINDGKHVTPAQWRPIIQSVFGRMKKNAGLLDIPEPPNPILEGMKP